MPRLRRSGSAAATTDAIIKQVFNAVPVQQKKNETGGKLRP